MITTLILRVEDVDDQLIELTCTDQSLPRALTFVGENFRVSIPSDLTKWMGTHVFLEYRCDNGLNVNLTVGKTYFTHISLAGSQMPNADALASGKFVVTSINIPLEM